MHRYLEFNAVKFLKDSRKWAVQVKKLQCEIDDIPMIKGRSDNPGRSGSISDPVHTLAVQRERITVKIQRIKRYQIILSRSLDTLTDPQKEALQLFFFGNEPITQAVEKYAEKYKIKPRAVYEIRKEALRNLADTITQLYL